MTTNVKVYFKSENAAESTFASLQTVKVNNMFIDELPENDNSRMYIPFFPTSIGNTGTFEPIIGESAALVTREGGNHVQEKLTHLLQFDVNAEDYNQALSILKQHECFNIKT